MYKVIRKSVYSLREMWAPHGLVHNCQPLLGSSFPSLSSIAVLL